MTSSIITLATFNKSNSKLAVDYSKTGFLQRKPLTVLVYWSESSEFTDNEKMTFAEFERRAFAVALNHAGHGYLKTKINVYFDDGEEYSCRVDLSANDEYDFQSHCESMIEFSNTPEGAAHYRQHDMDNFIEFIRGINFGDVDRQAQKSALEKAVLDAKNEQQQQQDQEELGESMAFDAEKAYLKTAVEYAHLTQGAYSAAEVAKNIRADLKKHFKGIKFSVRKSSYSCIYVRWQDGPTSEEVRAVLGKFKTGRFDAYTDYHYSEDSPFNAIFGGIEYLSESRDARGAHEIIKSHLNVDPVDVHRESCKLSQNAAGDWFYNGRPLAEVIEVRKPNEVTQDAAPVAITAPETTTEKPHFSGVLLADGWRVTISYQGRSTIFDNIQAPTLAAAYRQAWKLFTQPDHDPEPTGGKPLDADTGAAVVSLLDIKAERAVRAVADALAVAADAAAVVAIESALTIEQLPYKADALAALANASTDIVRHWEDNKSREIVSAADLAIIGTRRPFVVSRCSAEHTSLRDDTVVYYLGHGAECADLVAAAIAEQEQNRVIHAANMAPFSAIFENMAPNAGREQITDPKLSRFYTSALAAVLLSADRIETGSNNGEFVPCDKNELMQRAINGGYMCGGYCEVSKMLYLETNGNLCPQDIFRVFVNSKALAAAAEAEGEKNFNVLTGLVVEFCESAAAYEQQQGERREKLENRADKYDAESNRRYNLAHDAASAIPFGQPILVGHHSERRDRNYRAKINTNYDKAFKAADTADHYRSRAERVGSGGISSTDPAAVAKLSKKLVGLERSQNIMKQANALIRAGKREQLPELGLKEDCKGFAAYSLQNNNAEIRRVKERIKALAVAQLQETAEEEQCGAAVFSVADGRLCFAFDGKPPEEIRAILKRNGFKWAPSRCQWVRKNTANARYDANVVKKALIDM